jgi:hypothetical protein
LYLREKSPNHSFLIPKFQDMVVVRLALQSCRVGRDCIPTGHERGRRVGNPTYTAPPLPRLIEELHANLADEIEGVQVPTDLFGKLIEKEPAADKIFNDGLLAIDTLPAFGNTFKEVQGLRTVLGV